MSLILVPGQYSIEGNKFSHPDLTFTFAEGVSLPDPSGLTVDEYRFMVSSLIDEVIAPSVVEPESTADETPGLSAADFGISEASQVFIPVNFESPVAPIAVSGTGQTFRFDNIKRGDEQLYMQIFPVSDSMSLILPFILKPDVGDVTFLESCLNTLGQNLDSNPTAFVAFLAQLAFSPSGIGLFRGAGGVPQVYYFNTTSSVEVYLGSIDIDFPSDFEGFFPADYTESFAGETQGWLTGYSSAHPVLSE